MCPICRGKLVCYGWRKRKYKDTKGDEETLLIHRLWCGKCEKAHSELPDILMPYKRHCAETIENVINGSAGDICCENDTVRRIKQWWESMLPYIIGILESLTIKYGTVFSKPPKPKEVVRALVNTNNWIATRSACTSAKGHDTIIP